MFGFLPQPMHLLQYSGNMVAIIVGVFRAVLGAKPEELVFPVDLSLMILAVVSYSYRCFYFTAFYMHLCTQYVGELFFCSW